MRSGRLVRAWRRLGPGTSSLTPADLHGPRRPARGAPSGLVAVLVVALSMPAGLALAQAVDGRVVGDNGVVSTFGDVVEVGDVQHTWSVHEHLPELATNPSRTLEQATEDVLLAVAPGGTGDGLGAPLGSIQQALNRAARENAAGRSVRVRVQPGTYRESLQLSRATDATTASIVIEGVGDVTVSGSDVATGIQSLGGGRYAVPWDRGWGLGELPPRWAESYAGDDLAANPVIRRRELVFVDGRRLAPVATQAELDGTPESFWVDEAADRIVLRTSTDAAAATVEVARRDFLLRIGGRQNVTVRGIRFQHAASAMEQKAVQVNDSVDIRIVDCVVEQNSWYGLGLFRSSGVIVLRTSANENGSGGMTAFGGSDLLFEDTETSRNNWRGAIGQAHQPGKVNDTNLVDFAGGQKFFRLDGATFRRHRSADNDSSGLWFDYDNRNIEVVDSSIEGNRTWGIFVEANPGPVAIRRTTVSGNEFGVVIGNSEDGTIADSSIVGNRVEQVFVSGRDTRSIVATDGSTLSLQSQGWTITGSTIGVDGSADLVATHLPAEAWARFLSSLTASGNTFTGRR